MTMLTETVRVLRPRGRLGFSFGNEAEAHKCYKICMSLGLELTRVKSFVTESRSAMDIWVFVGVKKELFKK